MYVLSDTIINTGNCIREYNQYRSKKKKIEKVKKVPTRPDLPYYDPEIIIRSTFRMFWELESSPLMGELKKLDFGSKRVD